MESAREKSIRHGHPSTLHLWWARRPLAACRAVLWSSLVDDPSSWPEKFPTEEDQTRERQRLFDILGRITIEIDRKGNTKQVVRGLVSWDDIKDPAVIDEGQREIARSLAWGRGEDPPTQPDAVRDYIAKYAPPVYDPFAGGGSIPLEAQRLGLEAHASDLNPVAVLINKALIEIPPKFKDMPPVNPEDRKRAKLESWKGAQGLAADVRYYGKWLEEKAFEKLRIFYPEVEPQSIQKSTNSTVLCWIWARTVNCPNPACRAQMPLVSSFWLSKKKGRKTWIQPVIDRTQTPPIINFTIGTGDKEAPESSKIGRGAKFKCLACQEPTEDQYIKEEGLAGNMGTQLMATVLEGKEGRVYLPPDSKQVEAARSAEPSWFPDLKLGGDKRAIWCPLYGFDTFDKLFTKRQLLALSTFGELIKEAKEQALKDSLNREAAEKSEYYLIRNSEEYSNAISTFLAFALTRMMCLSSSLCLWSSHPAHELVVTMFSRQAIPMTWDFGEINPFCQAASWSKCLDFVSKVLEKLSLDGVNKNHVFQSDASVPWSLSLKNYLISTDPPYYDAVGYADLSDFFYIWLRKSLQSI